MSAVTSLSGTTVNFSAVPTHNQRAGPHPAPRRAGKGRASATRDRLSTQVWVPRGGQRWRAIEAMVAAAAALASFPQLYIYSAADAVVRDASIESHVRVRTRPAAAVGLPGARLPSQHPHRPALLMDAKPALLAVKPLYQQQRAGGRQRARASACQRQRWAAPPARPAWQPCDAEKHARGAMRHAAVRSSAPGAPWPTA